MWKLKITRDQYTNTDVVTLKHAIVPPGGIIPMGIGELVMTREEAHDYLHALQSGEMTPMVVELAYSDSAIDAVLEGLPEVTT